MKKELKVVKEKTEAGEIVAVKLTPEMIQGIKPVSD